ncbi:MAG: arginase family protein [Phycisphaerales bacterium]
MSASASSHPWLPHCRPPIGSPGIPPSRFAASIRTDSPEGCSFALLGMPDDLGVRLNSGRPGANDGPGAFRAALERYGVTQTWWADLPRLFDAGDVVPAEGEDAAALAATHERVSAAAAALAAKGMTVIGIGGGHDLTYALVRGVHRAHGHKTMSGLYFDAHLDVRDTPGSGMPFRKLVEDGIVKNLRIVGFNPLVNLREHAAWFQGRGGTIAPPGAVSVGGLETTGSFVSVDLDSLDASAAPGVSAPNPAGISASALTEQMTILGQTYDLRCIDFMELCPAHDEGGRTARLAAHLMLSYLYGVSRRGPSLR